MKDVSLNCVVQSPPPSLLLETCGGSGAASATHVELVYFLLFVQKVLGKTPVDLFAHAKRFEHVLAHLPLFLAVLPLFDPEVLLVHLV